MQTQHVGRTDEFDQVCDRLEAARTQGCRLVEIVGEAGIGKTMLIDRVLARAADQGYLLLTANADELMSGTPFGLFRELSSASDRWPQDLIEAATTGSRDDASADQQHRVADAIVEALQHVAQDQPVALSIDNAQWADAATVNALPAILRGVRDHPVLAIIASRSSPAVPELARLAETAMATDPLRLTLEGLSDLHVNELVALSLSAQPGPLLSNLLAGCAGNPFLIVETLRAVEGTEQLTYTDGTVELTGPTPKLSMDYVLSGLADLAQSTRTQLELCSIFGRGARLEDIAALGEWSSLATWEALEPAVLRGLLEADSSRVKFRHDLLREAVYEQIPAALRLAMHQSAARILTKRGAPPEAVAPHYEMCLHAGDPQALQALIDAATRVRHLAPNSAVRWFEVASRFSAEFPALHHEIATGLAEAYLFSGRVAEAEGQARATLATGVDEPYRSRVEMMLAATLFLDGRTGEAGELFVEIFTEAPDSGVDWGVAGVDGALTLLLTSDLDGAQDLLERVLAAECGVAAHAYAQAVKGLVLGLRGQVIGGIAVAQGGVSTANSSVDLHPHQNLPHFFLAQLQVWADRHTQARANIAAGRQIGTELGLGWHEPMYHMLLAESHLRTGDLDQAAAFAEAGLEYAADFNAHLEDARLHALLSELALYDEDLDTATAHLHRCDESQRTSGGHGADHFLRASALVALARGEGDAALANLELLWRAVDSLKAHLRLWEIAPDYVRELVGAGRHDDAEAVLRRLRELRPIFRPLTIAWCEALIAADLGMLQRVEANMAASDRPAQELAELRLDAARAAAEAGDDTLAAEYRALAEPFAPASASAPATSTTGSWRDLLSPAELRVVSLLGEGLTNAEIARELGRSRRTVESHLHHVYPKLQVQSRVELTVLIARD